MASKADDELVNRFRDDAKFLLDLFTNANMDAKLGFKRNFSGYVNGHKRPSVEKIDKFYQVYGKDIQTYKEVEAERSKRVFSQGPDQEFSGHHLITDIVDDLKSIKDFLASNQFTKELAEIRKKVDSIEDLLSRKPN